MINRLFLRFMLKFMLGYFLIHKLCTSAQVSIIAIFIYTMGIIYLDLLRPLKNLKSAIEPIDFSLDKIDFTKLDKYFYELNDDFGSIVNKFKELSDILAVRVDRVNAEEYKSEHDALSGLYNRTKYEKMRSEYAGYENICVIYIDVNNLKKTNDINGHEAGDALIVHAAEKLAFWNNIGDAYRMGGDEFMIVLADKSPEECEHLINKWYPKVGCLNDWKHDGFKCMMAYGVAHGGMYSDTDELIKQADEKMYHHKVQIKIANGEDPNSR